MADRHRSVVPRILDLRALPCLSTFLSPRKAGPAVLEHITAKMTTVQHMVRLIRHLGKGEITRILEVPGHRWSMDSFVRILQINAK